MKRILAHILYYTGILHCLLKLRSLDKNKLYILAYHRVVDDQHAPEFEDGLISVNTENFSRQLKVIKKYYDVVNFKMLDKSNSRSRIIVTFDDGYYDNYSKAYKLIKKNNLTATMYITVENINEGKMFWFDYVYKSLINLPAGDMYLESLNLYTKLNGSLSARKEIASEIMKKLKVISNSRRLKVLKELQEISSYPMSMTEDCKVMSWDDVIEMHENGIEIGSHTLTHPILSMQDDADIKKEVEQSKKIIEKKISDVVVSFAYPVGGCGAYNDEVINKLEQAGYQYAVVYHHGTNCINDERYTLQRIPIERYTTIPMFYANLSIPEIFK
jgi:peptidoglycan/xylan/chitin deacetylase (PgdA/CDA1 family)